MKIQRPPHRLAQVGPGLYFVCADFKTADGQHTYDLDFFVQGATKDQMAVQPDKTSHFKLLLLNDRPVP